jgi:hypothetical protein
MSSLRVQHAADNAVPARDLYNDRMRWINAVMLWMAVWGMAGCAMNVPVRPERVGTDTPIVEADKPIIVGRVVTLLLGPTTRWYGPHVRFVELMNRATQERYQVMIESDDRHFIVEIPAGDYELSRVQISEGPFMSLADLHESFTVLPERMTYVGTWRFGIDIPKYGRKVLVSMVEDDESRRAAERYVIDQYPEWADHLSVTVLPDPVVAESRLYEIASYPRIPRYFRRHWW